MRLISDALAVAAVVLMTILWTTQLILAIAAAPIHP